MRSIESSRDLMRRGAAASVVLVAALGAQPAAAQFGGVVIEGVQVVLEGAPADRAAAITRDTQSARVTSPTPIDRARAVTQSQGVLVTRPSAAARVGGAANSGVSSVATSPPPEPPARPRLPASSQTLFDDPGLLSEVRLCGLLNDPGTRDALNTGLRNLLSSQLQSKLPSGFGLHSRTNHQLGGACSARAEVVNDRITITATVPRNRYFAQITTPGPGGSDTDPNFHIFYDLTARATLLMPKDSRGRLVLESSRVTATNITKPESRNLISNVGFAINDLVTFFGGPDAMAQVRQDRAVSFGSMVLLDLGPVNDAIGRRLQTDLPTMRFEQSYKGSVLVLTATSRPAPPGPVVR